jgi:polar amino acid transport system permease protein
MKKVINYALAISFFVLLIVYVIFDQDASFNILPFYESPTRELISQGLLNTLFVSFIALVGSLIVGFIMYLLSISKSLFFRALVDVFTEIIYGTPLLVMIVVMAWLIGPAFGNFNRLTRPFLGVTGLILYISPYMKNVFQSSFSSIPKDQYMAMDLFGFTGWQRYQYIIIPQVIKVLMPPLMNNFSLIVKGSALLNVLAFGELYYAISVAQSNTFLFVEGYMLLWALYLIITIPLSQLSKWLERKLQS